MMTNTDRRWSVFIRWVSTLVSLSILASCATSGMSLKQYDDPTDVCNASRQSLMRTETDLKKWALGGAAVGAVAGAGVVAATGGDSKDVLLGMLIGSILGGTTGYLAGRRRAAKNKAELLAAIDNDAVSDSKRVNQITAAIKALGKCRQRQIEALRREFEAGSLSKETALARAESIQAAADKDNQLITRVLGRVDKRYNTYVDAKAEVLEVERRRVAAAPSVTDPLGNLAAETQVAKETQQANQEQTDLDMEALRILLS